MPRRPRRRHRARAGPRAHRRPGSARSARARADRAGRRPPRPAGSSCWSGPREWGRACRHDAPPASRANDPSPRRRPSGVSRSRPPVSTRPAAVPRPAASSAPSRSAANPSLCAVRRTNPASSSNDRHVREQPRQVALDLPRGGARSVAVGRRVEHDAGVSTAAPNLALGEGARVVDDPADGPVGEAGQGRVAPGPGDRRPGRVDMDDRRARPRPGRASRAPWPRTGAGRRARRRPTPAPERRPDSIAQPRQHRRVLREDAELASLRRSQLERHAVDRQRPRLARGRRADPATLAVVAQVGRRPRVRIAARAERRRMWPVDDPRPEPLEAGRATHVEQRVAGVRAGLRAWRRRAPAGTADG